MRTQQLLLCLVLAGSVFISGCGVLAVGAAGGAAGGAVESAKAERRGGYGAGTYTAAVLSNVAYFPAKAIFAGAGAVTSGAAYLVTLGDRSVSGPIWRSSVQGDYLVTPEMIAGDRPVHFVGAS